MNEFERDINDLLQDSEELEVEIGLPEGFLRKLKDEDDWSFVIKSAVLVEAAISTWLVDHLQQGELKDPLTFLDLANPKYGKIAITGALGLTTSFDRRFLLSLVELRNRLAHGIENISFSFSSYVSSLDHNQRKKFARSISYFFIREDASGDVEYPPIDQILKSAKSSIYLGLIMFLAIVGLNMKTKRSERKSEKLRVKILENEVVLKKIEAKRTGLGALGSPLSGMLK